MTTEKKKTAEGDRMFTDTNRPAKPRILVVEDNYFMAKTVCELVRDCGFDVAGAVGRVEAGQRFLEENHVDGAIVDINLDGTPSFPLCDELVRRSVPFFFLTAYERSAIPDAFRNTRLLTKPVEMKDFRSALTSLAPHRPLAPERRDGSFTRGNRLLQGLGAETWRMLQPHLEKTMLKRSKLLTEPGRVPEHVVFPTGGLISINALSGRRAIEVALVGNEGLVGVTALLGLRPAVNEAVVRLPGEAWQVAAAKLTELLPYSAELNEMLMHYVGSLLRQISQTTLVVGHAPIEQRLARWLLMVAERTDSDRIEITHDALARSLGVRRAGITVAMHLLESRGAVKSMRKLVRVLDREALARLAGDFHSPLERG
ncbi:MAG TPA: helix-turn-helix domain-containing protein [Reyranella sp.]|nr:helix-turn-helix domain-containing protein [Reyranella sp.]